MLGVILLGFGVFDLFTYRPTENFQQTFNVLAGNRGYIFPFILAPSEVMGGQFQETSGRPIRVYVQSSAQYAVYEAGGIVASLYTVQDVSSGNISYKVKIQDTYYILFTHGAGLENTTETVHFQYFYQAHRSDLFWRGIGAIVLGAANIAWGVFRRTKSRKLMKPPPSPQHEAEPKV